LRLPVTPSRLPADIEAEGLAGGGGEGEACFHEASVASQVRRRQTVAVDAHLCLAVVLMLPGRAQIGFSALTDSVAPPGPRRTRPESTAWNFTSRQSCWKERDQWASSQRKITPTIMSNTRRLATRLSKQPSVIRLGVNARRHAVTVDVHIKESNVDGVYVDSGNMNYVKHENGQEVIHPKYNKCIKNLRKSACATAKATFIRKSLVLAWIGES
jgi:hypothetical protein